MLHGKAPSHFLLRSRHGSQATRERKIPHLKRRRLELEHEMLNNRHEAMELKKQLLDLEDDTLVMDQRVSDGDIGQI